MKLAFASIDGRSLDCHFERCPSFSIFDFYEDGYNWLESRYVPQEAATAGNLEEHGDADDVELRIRTVQDCQVLFVQSIDHHQAQRVTAAGIMIIQSDSVTGVIAQLDRMQEMLKNRPPLWLTKALLRSKEGL